MESERDIDNPFADYCAPQSMSAHKVCAEGERDEEADNHAESSKDSNKEEEDKPDLKCFFHITEEAEELGDIEFTKWESKHLLGKTFATIEAAEAFYIAYSRKMGFGIRRDNKEIDKQEGITTMRRLICHREGRTKESKSDTKKQRCMARTRCSCKAAFVVRYNKEMMSYKVTTFNPQHSHTLAKPGQSHFFRCNRRITIGQSMEIRKMKVAGIRTCRIMDYMVAAMGGFDKVGFTIKDLYNHVNWDHERKTRLDWDAEATIAYLTALTDLDRGIFVKYALNEDNQLCRLLWVDSCSKWDYNQFGDVLVIDSTYRTNTFRLPLVEFVGVNNHRSTVIFACCFLSDETIDAYTWAFSTFIEAMEGKEPGCVLTNGDRSIAAALNTEMPRARHRLCSWHLMRNARVVSSATDFLTKLSRVMRHPNSEAEFEDEWRSLLEEYNLIGNEWMEELYERKQKWAEPFFSGVFNAGVTTSQRCESVHSYMSKFVNAQMSLYNFVQQFCRATCRIRQQTLRNDFINNQTSVEMDTHLKGLEKTTLDFYSRAVYMEVRQEIKRESVYTPTGAVPGDGFKNLIMVKYGDDTCKEISVTIRDSDKFISCECGRFESLGWPCRHMFCAMKTANMTSIPEVLLNKRCAKDCSRMDNLFSNKELSIKDHKDRRFSFLHPKLLQICTIASASDDLYRIAVQELEKTKAIIFLASDKEKTTTTKTDVGKEKKRKRLLVNPVNILRDPCFVRTKGIRSETKTTKGKTRKCRLCRQPGHYKSSCPIVNDVTASQNNQHTAAEEGGDDNENEDGSDDLFY